MRGGRWVIGALAAASLGAGLPGCTELGGPGTVVSLQFDSLIAPAVVVNDTLRNHRTGELGVLTAMAFGPEGEPLPDVEVRFVVVEDDLLRIVDETGYVIALPTLDDTTSADTARIVAIADGLQSRAIPLVIVREPVAIAATSALRDTLEHDRIALVNSAPFSVRVTNALGKGVPAWLVHFRVVSDDSLGYLVSAGAQPSTVDTTDATGVASRIFRLDPLLLPNQGATEDSVLVQAIAYRRGEPLQSDTVTFTLLIRPRAAS